MAKNPEIDKYVDEHYPEDEILLLEPRELLDAAFIGIVQQSGEGPPLALYDEDLVISLLAEICEDSQVGCEARMEEGIDATLAAVIVDYPEAVDYNMPDSGKVEILDVSGKTLEEIPILEFMSRYYRHDVDGDGPEHMSPEEYFEYHIKGEYVGENGPVFLNSQSAFLNMVS